MDDQGARNNVHPSTKIIQVNIHVLGRTCRKENSWGLHLQRTYHFEALRFNFEIRVDGSCGV
uniref:Uncharacterized protein n=1 Tax=Solanum lycopersicum TaxID=4081 RepID=A0A3Q7J6P5_SOLLC